MKSNSRRKNKATPSVKAHNKNKKRQVAEAAAAKAREGSFHYKHPAAGELGKIWDGFDVPIESVDVFLFWEKKDGVWVEVPDGDVLDKVDAQTKRYIGRRRDPKTGEWQPEWRDIEVSKEAIRKARERAEKTGLPVELPVATSCEKFEVQFSPHHLAYGNKVMAKIRAAKLAAGATEKEANLAADAWVIDVTTRVVPKLGDYLEWRTGRRVFFTPLHTISGKWHLTPWTTYVGADGHIQGMIQCGRGGRTIVGYESQIDAGYELPPHRLEVYKRKLATEKSRAKRYADKRFVDVGLSQVLLDHMRAEMEARGEQDLWEEACAEYRAALVAAEPLKQELERFKEAREAEYLDKVTEAGKRKRDVRIEGLKPALQEELQEIFDDETMRKLTKVYSLPKIAGLVVDGLVKVKQIAAWARESLERLLSELARLFSGAQSATIEAEKPALSVVEADAQEAVEVAEKPAPVVLAVVAAPVFAPVAAEQDDRDWLARTQAVLQKHTGVPVGRELGLFLANVEKGLARESGLTQAQFDLGVAQMEGVAVWIQAQEVAQKVSAATPPPAGQETQSGEVEAPPSVAWDESPFLVPANLQALRTASMVMTFERLVPALWRNANLPTRDAAIRERVLHLVALKEAGKLTQGQVTEILEKSPFGPLVAIAAKVIAQDDDAKSVDAAIAFIQGGLEKGK